MDDFGSTTPAMEPVDEAPPTKWPKVIGIISLIYGILGVTCTGCGVGWVTVGAEVAMKAGGMKLEIPGLLKLLTVGNFLVLVLPVGIYMIMGASALLRRRPAGVVRLRRWAVIRIVILLLMIPVGLLTTDLNVDMQRRQIDATNEMFRDQGRSDMVQEFDPARAARNAYLWMGASTVAFALFPFFIAFYLYRNKIDEEIALWI